MTEKEKEIIRDLSKCGFKEIDAHFKLMSEQRKARSKEERKAEKVIDELEEILKQLSFVSIISCFCYVIGKLPGLQHIRNRM